MAVRPILRARSAARHEGIEWGNTLSEDVVDVGFTVDLLVDGGEEGSDRHGRGEHTNSSRLGRVGVEESRLDVEERSDDVLLQLEVDAEDAVAGDAGSDDQSVAAEQAVAVIVAELTA